MKKMFKSLLAGLAMLVAFAATPAFATDPDPGPCGNQCFDSTTIFQVGGTAASGGFGASVFEGAEGGNEVTKQGYAQTETMVDIAGGLCGVDCQDGSFAFKGAAGEFVQTMTWASGSEAGVPTTATNQAAAFSNVGFQFNKLTVIPSQ